MRTLFLIVLLVLLPAAQARQPEGVPQMPSDESPEGVFNEAWLVVRSAFYSPDFNGADWTAIREELLPRAREAKSPADVSQVINDALARLKASHTHHYIQSQREYYELLDVFYPDGIPERSASKLRSGPVEYVGIGLAATVIDGHAFAADVYSGGPADEAGIMTGDELISVEGGPWGDVAPFRGREGRLTKVTIQRTPDAASRKELQVMPAVIHPREAFLKAISSSARVVEISGRKIAYVRLRSYAHEDYHDGLKQLIQSKFADADGLVIDIRGGWGGASPQYMDIFNPYSPKLEYISRDGTHRKFSTTWRKPVALLIDSGSRSGKEVLAYAFKEHKIGLLVGERTAGAVLAGTPRPLADGSLLYIAVNAVTVDGVTIEGKGVEPDISIKRTLPYSAGRDEQLDGALAAVAKRCAEQR